MDTNALVKSIRRSLDCYDETKDIEHLFDIVRAYKTFGFPFESEVERHEDTVLA